MKTSLLARVDPLNSEAAYVGVVGLSLVLSVFVGMSLAGPDEELIAHMQHAAPGTDTKVVMAVVREEMAPGATGSHPLQSQHATTAVEVKAVTPLLSLDRRQ